MCTAPRRTTSPRHLAWLVWLALLLPLAQMAAASHALSHALSHAVSAAAEEDDVPRALQQSHCDLCLMAAAVNGGALSVLQAAAPDTMARHALPQRRDDAGWAAAFTWAYRSRAPPFAEH